MELNTLHDLFIMQMEQLYAAHKQAISYIKELNTRVSSSELHRVLAEHVKESEDHLRNLDEIASGMNTSFSNRTCKIIQGIVNEGKELLKARVEKSVLDAAIVYEVQKLAHYKIAALGTARAFAAALKHRNAADLLATLVEEEQRLDRELSELAINDINRAAA